MEVDLTIGAIRAVGAVKATQMKSDDEKAGASFQEILESFQRKEAVRTVNDITDTGKVGQRG